MKTHWGIILIIMVLTLGCAEAQRRATPINPDDVEIVANQICGYKKIVWVDRSLDEVKKNEIVSATAKAKQIKFKPEGTILHISAEPYQISRFRQIVDQLFEVNITFALQGNKVLYREVEKNCNLSQP
jgi:hypothetical protein